MREYIKAVRARFFVAPMPVSKLFLCAAFAGVAACGNKADDQALTTDSALGRDLAMAARDTTVQPELRDVPATPPPPATAIKPATTKPRPRAPAPSPTPPTVTPPTVTPTPVPAPAVPATGTVAAGTTLKFASNSKVCTNTNKVGDKFTAALSESVDGSNGASIPAGATGTFEVTDAKTAKNSNDKTYLTIRLLSVQYGGRSYAVESTLQSASTDRVRGASTATDVKKVAGGAIIGAIAGQIIGKNTKGTVIGAAAGAAAGTAAAAATADFETCLNGGANVIVKLDAPATIRVVASN